MDFNGLAKSDLSKLHVLILTMIKFNKINLLSLGKVEDDKICLLNNQDLWYLYDMNGNDYILSNLEFACQIIIRTFTNSKEESDEAFKYFYKLILLNIPIAELQDYLEFYKKKEDKKEEEVSSSESKCFHEIVFPMMDVSKSNYNEYYGKCLDCEMAGIYNNGFSSYILKGINYNLSSDDKEKVYKEVKRIYLSNKNTLTKDELIGLIEEMIPQIMSRIIDESISNKSLDKTK